VRKTGKEKAGKTIASELTKDKQSRALPLPEGFTPEQDRWEYLWLMHRLGRTVDARVTKVTFPENLATAVWEVDLGDGVKGVVPLGESGLAGQGLMMRYVGQVVRVKISGLDREMRVAACSRRAALAEAKERLMGALAPGQVIDVMVKAVLGPAPGKPPFVLVDVGGGVVAEVPRGAATKIRTERMESIFRPGQQVKAKVLSVDRESDVIRVSMAAVEPDAWQENYQRGHMVAGRVINQKGGLVFVEIKPGLVGIADPPLRGRLRNGERVRCVVTVYRPRERKMHLQIRGRLAY